MRFAIQLNYSLDGKFLEIPKDDVTFLEGKKIWSQVDDSLRKTCMRVGPHASALAMTGIHLQDICSWATINSFRGDNTVFELMVPEEKAEDFEHLVKTGELKRQLNERFQEVANKDIEEDTEKSDENVSNILSNVAVTGLKMDPGEPVPVLLEGEDGSPLLDHDALARVLLHANIGNRPVALISIAGAFRKGKSFMLNFFLRYLRNKGYKYDDWLGDDNTPLDDGFAWRGGAKRHTVGISMWSEPLIVRRHGEEIAVFLLDTQGNFDQKAGKEQCTKIFAISMLLSSVLVFNVHTQVQENDMDYLQFATEYSRVAKDHKDKISPFQKLMFLVRDWPNLDDFDYGLDGGQEYLKNVVLQDDPDAVNKSLGQIRKHLRESFSSIVCYLMPEPGKNVRITRKGQHFDGSLKGIDKEFLEHVGELTNTLLHPDNLVIKEGMTAQSLMYFIIGCCNAIKNNKDGKLPVPATIMETAAESLATDSLIQCMDRYDDDLQKALGVSQTFLPWEDFKQCETEVRKKVEKTFYESLKFGDESFKQRQTNKLRSRLDRAKGKFVRRNKLNEMKGKNDIGELVLHLTSEYEDDFKKALEDQTCFEQDSFLEKRHQKLLAEMENTLLSEISKYGGEQTGFEEEKELLRYEIKDMFELIKLQFYSNKEAIEVGLQHVVCKSVEKYEKEIKKAMKDSSLENTDVTESDIENFHVKAEIEAKSHFEDKKLMSPESMVAESRQQLEKFIADSKRNFLDGIAQEKKSTENMILKRMVKKHAEFSDMETGSRVVSAASIKEMSKKFDSFAVDIYNSCKAEKDSMEEAYTFEDWIFEKESLLDLSLRRMRFREAKVMYEVLQVKKTCTENVFTLVQATRLIYWEEEELDRHLKEREENLFNEMKEVERERYATDDDRSHKYAEDMREIARKAFAVARHRNARNKVRNQQLLELDLLEKTLIYSREMEKELRGAYVEPSVLDQMHEKLLENALSPNLCRMTQKAYEIHEKEIKKALDERFEEFKKWNEENKSFFSRVIGRVAAGFATVEVLAFGGTAGVLGAAEILSLGAAAGLAGAGLGAAVISGALIVGVGSLITMSLTSKNIDQYFAETKTKITSKIQNIKKRGRKEITE